MKTYYLKVRGNQISLTALGNLKGVDTRNPEFLSTIDKLTTSFEHIDELEDVLKKKKKITDASSGETCVKCTKFGEKDLPILFQDNLKFFDPNNLKQTYQNLKREYVLHNDKNFCIALFNFICNREDFGQINTYFKDYIVTEEFYSSDFHSIKDEIFYKLLGSGKNLDYEKLREFSIFMFNTLGYEDIRKKEAEKRNNDEPEQFTFWNL